MVEEAVPQKVHPVAGVLEQHLALIERQRQPFGQERPHRPRSVDPALPHGFPSANRHGTKGYFMYEPSLQVVGSHPDPKNDSLSSSLRGTKAALGGS